MRIRTVGANELDLFVEAGGAPEHRREVKSYVEDMFAAGSMRPEWCFVLEDGDRAVGRVALWTLPKSAEPLDAVLLDVPWNGEYLSLGELVLVEVLGEARALGATEIGHVLDSPPMWPQFQHHPEERAELLGLAGFALKRETVRFEWRGKTAPEASGGRSGSRRGCGRHVALAVPLALIHRSAWKGNPPKFATHKQHKHPP